MSITKQSLSIIDMFLAILVGIFGLVIALMTLRRGVWIDEFMTISRTTPDLSLREFLVLMTQDLHAILDYGMVYLLQAVGVIDVVQLRSINLLGLPLVIFAVAYGFRQKAISISQALTVWVLFASAPIFFEYFAELRPYFLLYAASIATSVLWYVQMRRIETGEKLTWRMISIWAACLAIFVNLHHFATIFGGMLTTVLMARLAIGRMWSQVLVIGSVSFAAAMPSLILGALQISTITINEPWIKTGPIESIKMAMRIVENATSRNFVAAAGAAVMCLYFLEDRKKRIELKTSVILLGVVALFLSVLVLINAVHPIMVDRYLIACAGAVTFSLAILAASSGAAVWLPAATSVIALLLQAQTLRSNLGIDQRGWLPSARAVAQLKSECPTSKIFAYPALNHTSRSESMPYDIAFRLKLNLVSYGYYAKKFQFPYEDLQPGATVAASGPCPSIIWIEHLSQFFDANPNADAELVLREFQINKVGVADLKRFGSAGAVIIVHD